MHKFGIWEGNRGGDCRSWNIFEKLASMNLWVSWYFIDRIESENNWQGFSFQSTLELELINFECIPYPMKYEFQMKTWKACYG